MWISAGHLLVGAIKSEQSSIPLVYSLSLVLLYLFTEAGPTLVLITIDGAYQGHLDVCSDFSKTHFSQR